MGGGGPGLGIDPRIMLGLVIVMVVACCLGCYCKNRNDDVSLDEMIEDTELQRESNDNQNTMRVHHEDIEMSAVLPVDLVPSQGDNHKASLLISEEQSDA
jgi:hypothetical protein